MMLDGCRRRQKNWRPRKFDNEWRFRRYKMLKVFDTPHHLFRDLDLETCRSRGRSSKFVGSNHHVIDLDFKPKNSTPRDKKNWSTRKFTSKRFNFLLDKLAHEYKTKLGSVRQSTFESCRSRTSEGSGDSQGKWHESWK